MPFVPVAHLFSVTQTLLQPNGDQALNVFHGRMNSGSIDGSHANAIADDIGAAWQAHLRAYVKTAITVADYVVRDLSVAGGRTYTKTSSATNGSSTSQILPEQLAVCTTLNKGSGPSARGRVYHAGFTVAGLSETSSKPIVASALIAAIDLWIEDMGAAFADNGATWVVYSRKLAATTDVDVTRTPTDQRFDVQRRRANHRPII